jgi:hypothetical protein
MPLVAAWVGHHSHQDDGAVRSNIFYTTDCDAIKFFQKGKIFSTLLHQKKAFSL